MADLFGEMELAQGAGIFGHIGAVGGVNLSGLPNVGGHGTPGMRSGRQRLAVNNLHRGKPNPFQPPQMAQETHQDQGHSMQYQQPRQQSMGDYMHPMQREGLNQYNAGMKATNDAIEREMNSRVEQSRDWDQMAHEQHLAGMKHQSEMAKIQGDMAMRQQELGARNQKNSALMRAAGLGGTTTVNGQPADSFGPFRQSLLG
jgi:hypothetical protein